MARGSVAITGVQQRLRGRRGREEVFHGNREAQVCSDCCRGEAAGRLPSSEHLT